MLSVSRRGFLNVALLTAAAPCTANQPYKPSCTTVSGIEECQKLLSNELCIAPPGQLQGVDAAAEPPKEIRLNWGNERVAPPTPARFQALLERNVLAPLSEVFGVQPTFSYYDDKSKPNAKASPDGRGTILFGTTLLSNTLSMSEGDYAVMAICAHEYAHIKQFQSGVQRDIARDLPCYCIELHADFLAGYFLKRAEASIGAINTKAVSQVWSAWQKDSCSHGTNTQRFDAIEQGYFHGDRVSASDAVKAGIVYLRKYR